MNWLDIKKRARENVHGAFSLPALFRRKSGGAEISGTARLHYKVRKFGDLDREGYGTVVENIDSVVIDNRVFTDAKEGDRVFFPALNRAFKLDVRGESEDDIFVKWEVTEVSP